LKKNYFISDAHLGSRAIPNSREQEKHLCRFLDEIKSQAESIYILGDLFDFWFEYKHVVPKGYTRLLGKLSELTDMGIAVHFFTGNHDIWCKDYLTKECGIIMHYGPETINIEGKNFFMAHGDGLGDPDRKFKFISRMFHNKVCQRLFSTLHPRWSMWFGLTWAKHSRMKRADGKEEPYKGEDREFLIQYTKEYMKTHPDIDYYIYGHRHIELDMMLSRKSRMMIIGDWIWQFTYVVFDGEHIFLEQYVEGESQL
jgi:UDP-2,3-diacylglucosamine hydrolase